MRVLWWPVAIAGLLQLWFWIYRGAIWFLAMMARRVASSVQWTAAGSGAARDARAETSGGDHADGDARADRDSGMPEPSSSQILCAAKAEERERRSAWIPSLLQREPEAMDLAQRNLGDAHALPDQDDDLPDTSNIGAPSSDDLDDLPLVEEASRPDASAAVHAPGSFGGQSVLRSWDLPHGWVWAAGPPAGDTLALPSGELRALAASDRRTLARLRKEPVNRVDVRMEPLPASFEVNGVRFRVPWPTYRRLLEGGALDHLAAVIRPADASALEVDDLIRQLLRELLWLHCVLPGDETPALRYGALIALPADVRTALRAHRPPAVYDGEHLLSENGSLLDQPSDSTDAALFNMRSYAAGLLGLHARQRISLVRRRQRADLGVVTLPMVHGRPLDVRAAGCFAFPRWRSAHPTPGWIRT